VPQPRKEGRDPDSRATLTSNQPNNAFPNHVAIIMDGNGRWAQSRHLLRSRGHQVGAKVVKECVEEASRLGVKLLTLYAFSIENWKRPKTEVSFLMRLLERFLAQEEPHLMKNNVVLESIGRIEALPAGVRSQLQRVKEATSSNTGLRLCLALNYGGRAEIADAAKKIAQRVKDGTLSVEQIDEDTVRQHLYADAHGRQYPDPDLVIRTAGEMRLSNFLLWQASYAELYVTDVCWPDFRPEHLRAAVAEYARRERKFGGLKGSTGVPHQSSDGLVLDSAVSGSDTH